MKKNGLIISLIVILIITLFVINIPLPDSKEVIVDQLIDRHQGDPYQSLDQLILNSAVIASGTIRDVSEFKYPTNEYLFIIDECFKGDFDSDWIYIYQSNNLFEIGQEYVMFLNRWEGGLYPEPVHTSINIPDIVAIHGDKISHNFSFLGDDLTKDNFFHTIKQSRFINTPPYYLAEFEDQISQPLALETTADLIKESDVIARVVPSDLVRENKYFKSIKVNVLELYKENDDGNSPLEDETIYVPNSIELEKEHLIFIRIHNGIYQVTTREGSVISKDDEEQWNEVIGILETE